jgi:hypothetical protein
MLGRAFGLLVAMVAAMALVTASGAATKQAQRVTRIDVSTRAAVVHYLRSIHVSAKGVVIQRGARNYAGVRCPGTRWTCASTRHTVVQIAKRGGQNRFVCRSSRCVVVQFAGVSHGVYIRRLASTAAANKGNTATCIKTRGLGASCSITQSGGGTAIVWEDAGKKTGLTQTALYTASITQTSGSVNNLACVHQGIFIDGSTTNTKSSGATVTLEAHQSIIVKQDSASGGNTAENATYNPSTGVAGCDVSALSQNQTLQSFATSKGPITQNQNDTFSACGDGVAGDYANMCLDIEQNQGIDKGVASGLNTANFDQESTQTAVANTSGTVVQTQSSICTGNTNAPGDCVVPGGLVGTVNQDSSSQSIANATQNENQCEDAKASSLTPLTSCDHPNDPDSAEGPSSLTQNQYGPVGIGKLRHKHRGRQLYGHLKGLGTAKQTGNDNCTTSCDSFTINQTSTQDTDQGSGSNQQNTGQADCQTSGNCTATQTTTVDGQPTTNTQSGQNVNAQTTCNGSTCATSSNTIVGNNAADGGGPIQTYDLSTGSLVNSFVPDGAQVPGANGRAVAVQGDEIFYSELSNGLAFGPSDGIHAAPFNAGAGGSDVRVLSNPAPTTGIQDLAFSNGNLYALTGYPDGTLQAWELNPISGTVIAGPVAIGSPAAADADGFAVLPDGNFLINDGDALCTYREYDSITGQPTGGSITVPGEPSFCTGVETDGSSLFFQTNFHSFTKTDLSGNLIATTNVASNEVEDVSLG